MNGTLETYRGVPDPPEGEPFEFEVLDERHEGYRPPYEGPVVVPERPDDIDEADPEAPAFKYDFPPEDERDRVAPVSYLPIERLGVRIQKDPG